MEEDKDRGLKKTVEEDEVELAELDKELATAASVAWKGKAKARSARVSIPDMKGAPVPLPPRAAPPLPEVR